MVTLWCIRDSFYSVHHCCIEHKMGCSELSWAGNWKQFQLFSCWNERRLLDRPDIAAMVYNQFAIAIVKDLVDTRNNNWDKVLWIHSKSFVPRWLYPTPPYFVIFERWRTDDVNTNSDVISAVLATDDQYKELRDLGKNFYMQHNSLYRSGRTRNHKVWLGKFTIEATPSTNSDTPIDRGVYRTREQEDLKGVPYNPYLTKKYWRHANVKRTQGGEVVAHLNKYPFTPPTMTYLQMMKSQKLKRRSRNSALHNDWDEIRLYMQSKVTAPIDAVWSLSVFRQCNTLVQLCNCQSTLETGGIARVWFQSILQEVSK